MKRSKAIPTIKLPPIPRYEESQRIHTIVISKNPKYYGMDLPKISENPYLFPEPPHAMEYTPQEPLVSSVDELFNEFIAYPGPKIQPFLSQYCDGIRISCAFKKWLEQIKSVQMAREGIKYKAILKFFYGENTKQFKLAP